MYVKITLRKKVLNTKIRNIIKAYRYFFNSNWSISRDIRLYKLFTFSLFHDANIKEENISIQMQLELQGNCSYLTTNKKTQNTFIVVFDLKIYWKMKLCAVTKKKHTKLIVIIGWLAGNEWTWNR